MYDRSIAVVKLTNLLDKNIISCFSRSLVGLTKENSYFLAVIRTYMLMILY